MKKNAGDILPDLSKFQNIRTKIKVSMFIENKDIKGIDEKGFKKIKEVDFEKNAEFGIFDLNENTEISFEFGSIRINKKKFKEVLKRYFGRNEFIRKLK